MEIYLRDWDDWRIYFYSFPQNLVRLFYFNSDWLFIYVTLDIFSESIINNYMNCNPFATFFTPIFTELENWVLLFYYLAHLYEALIYFFLISILKSSKRHVMKKKLNIIWNDTQFEICIKKLQIHLTENICYNQEAIYRVPGNWKVYV